MNAEFWTVDAKSPEHLPFTSDDVCKHLLADWMPFLPAFVGSSFVGWPPFLLKPTSYKRRTYLCLAKQVGQAERQWKGFLSWMLGIAGTRQFLREDGYRWIAPVSAFLDSAVKPVALKNWPTSLPKSIVSTRRRPRSGSRLLPDYLALRPTTRAGGFNWAAVESKGTHWCLTNRTKCPQHWYDQAHNVQVLLHKKLIRIPRHVVVATRVNPNAARDSSRRIQIRAWNSADAEGAETSLPKDGVVDLVSGHLFGFFRALRLFENARAIAYGMQSRANPKMAHGSQFVRQRVSVFAAAENELRERIPGEDVGSVAASQEPRTLFIESDFAGVEVRIDPALLYLARAIAVSDSVEAAATAVRVADERLDKTESTSEGSSNDSDESRVSAGVSVRIRRRFSE